MKKILTALLVFVLCFSFYACGTGNMSDKALKSIEEYRTTHFVDEFFVDQAKVYSFEGLDDKKYDLMFIVYTEKNTGDTGFYMTDLKSDTTYDESDFYGINEADMFNSIWYYGMLFELSLNGYAGLELLNDTVEVTEFTSEELSDVNEDLF